MTGIDTATHNRNVPSPTSMVTTNVKVYSFLRHREDSERPLCHQMFAPDFGSVPVDGTLWGAGQHPICRA